MLRNSNFRKQTENIMIDGVTYLKIGQLGSGQEGVIYKAKNIQTNEMVAIKEYMTINQNEQKAFVAIRQKSYSHIIGIKGLQYTQDQYPIIVMEFADGEFYNLMKSNDYSKLSYQQRNQYFLQMVQGVSQLHQLGLFHRDLKPENFVYINQPNQQKIIKLIDFGLVKETANKLANTGCIGTPYYIAPEVIKCNQNRVAFYDKSVDVWSLGAIWYEILVGETFFNGNTQQQIFNQILNISQIEIDQKIQQNPMIQQKEKDLIKEMLVINPILRLQLEKIINIYNQQENQYIQQNQNQQNLQINFNKNYQKNQQIQAQFKQGQFQFNQAQYQFNNIFTPQQQALNNNFFHISQQQLNFQDNQKQKQEIEELNKILDKIQEETKKKMQDEYQQKLRDFEIKKEEEMLQMKRQIEMQKEEELLKELEQLKNRQRNEFEQQLKEKEAELKKQQQEFFKQQQDNEQLAKLKFQQEIQLQNEMDKFIKIKEEEQNTYLQKYKEQENQKKEEIIKQILKEKETQIKQQIEMEIQTKYQLEYANKVSEFKNQQLQESQQQLQNKKQSLINLLQSQQISIKQFNNDIEQKLQIIENIILFDEQKNKLIQLIKSELEKNNENLQRNAQMQLQIQKVQKQEQLQGLDTQLASEISQNIQNYNNVMQMILEQQILLQNQLGDQQNQELEQKENQKRLEQEQQLYQEKQNFQQKFQNFQHQSDQYTVNINKIQQRIQFYEKIQYEIQLQEIFQEILRQFQNITQELLVLEEQEKTIIQIEKTQQLIYYQSLKNQLEEVQQAQNRLRNLIDEVNKSIEQVDSKFIQEHQRQIELLDDNLNDYSDQFIYLSQNQKYAVKINEQNSQLCFCFEQLNELNQLLKQGMIQNYQKFKQIFDSITQQLQEFQKQHNLIFIQILNDKQIEQRNADRIKKLKQIEGQLNEFINKMNQLKISVNDFSNNQYCNNEQTANLIADKQSKIDQNINSIQEQYQNFLKFNNLISCDTINFQIIELEQFQEKLKQQLLVEQEKVTNLQLVIQKIGNEYKTEQEKEYFQLNNDLQLLLMKFSRDLSLVKIDQENIDNFKTMNEKKEELQKQLKEEIELIDKYYKISKENNKLLNELIISNKNRKSIFCNNFMNLLNNLKFQNEQKTKKLEKVYQNAHNLQHELRFGYMDNNFVNNYKELKKQEDLLFQEINKLGQEASKLQLNPSAFNQKKERMEQLIKQLNHLIEQIPLNNKIIIFNNEYKSNLESFQILYASVNYIKQYHLTRYYERIKEGPSKQKKKFNEKSSYIAIFQQKRNAGMEENTRKEKEAQNLLSTYENILFKNNNKKMIEQLQNDYEQISKQINEAEILIKSQNLVRLRGSIKNQNKIQEIMKQKQYYKIAEFVQMLELQIIQEKI